MPLVKEKIVKYLNGLNKKPTKKDIDNLVKKFKISIPSKNKTKDQIYKFILKKYQIKPLELYNELTVKDLKKVLHKNNIKNIGNSKKQMFQILSKYQNQNRIYSGFHTERGKRQYQEDRLSIFHNVHSHYISCIYDGHGGNKCSTYLKKHFYKKFLKNLQLHKKNKSRALFNTFVELDKDFLNSVVGRDGSTANIFYCDKKSNTCYVGNTGDSRAILYKKNGECKQITEDHKPDDTHEKIRIESKGGFVVNNRTNGNLAMSRSLGDRNLKNVITAEPDIFEFSLRNVRYVIQASDGLWDVMGNAEVCNFVNRRLGKMDLNQISEELVNHAIHKKGSMDNTSVIITYFE